jgi:hypothetical protein
MTCEISSCFYVLKKFENIEILALLFLYQFFLNFEEILLSKITIIDIYEKSSNLKSYF